MIVLGADRCERRGTGSIRDLTMLGKQIISDVVIDRQRGDWPDIHWGDLVAAVAVSVDKSPAGPCLPTQPSSGTTDTFGTSINDAKHRDFTRAK